MKTIRLVKNMNYLTEKLPKPNYSPVRYRSLKSVNNTFDNLTKFMGGSLQVLSKLNKSLEKSKASSNGSFVSK